MDETETESENSKGDSDDEYAAEITRGKIILHETLTGKDERRRRSVQHQKLLLLLIEII